MQKKKKSKYGSYTAEDMYLNNETYKAYRRKHRQMNREKINAYKRDYLLRTKKTKKTT